MRMLDLSGRDKGYKMLDDRVGAEEGLRPILVSSFAFELVNTNTRILPAFTPGDMHIVQVANASTGVSPSTINSPGWTELFPGTYMTKDDPGLSLTTTANHNRYRRITLTGAKAVGQVIGETNLNLSSIRRPALPVRPQDGAAVVFLSTENATAHIPMLKPNSGIWIEPFTYSKDFAAITGITKEGTSNFSTVVIEVLAK